jgi:CDP-diacylglycerol--glycerol-3-phosphate 3-phosphatidyltransferase
MAEFVFISEKNKERYLKIVSPFGNLLSKIGIHPNVLTTVGLVLSIVAGVFYGIGSFFWAAWIVVLAGTCDVLDGLIARKRNQNSKFGAFYDSTLDRYSDFCLYAGIAYFFAKHPSEISKFSEGSAIIINNPWTIFIIIMAIAGSFMVSYTRARAEGLGVECKVGLMQRPERIVLLIIGSLLGAIPGIGIYIMKLTLLILAITSNLTAFYRMYHVKNRILQENGMR